MQRHNQRNAGKDASDMRKIKSITPFISLNKGKKKKEKKEVSNFTPRRQKTWYFPQLPQPSTIFNQRTEKPLPNEKSPSITHILLSA